MSDHEYSAYDRDVSQRILHSETRIKNWVIGGVLANVLVLIGVGAPMVWYLGQLSAVANVSVGTVTRLDSEVRKLREDSDRMDFRQTSMVEYLQRHGYQVPPERRE